MPSPSPEYGEEEEEEEEKEAEGGRGGGRRRRGKTFVSGQRTRGIGFSRVGTRGIWLQQGTRG